jgi:hypothetical protein
MVDDTTDPEAEDPTDSEPAAASRDDERLPELPLMRVALLVVAIALLLAGDVLTYVLLSNGSSDGVVGFREIVVLIGGFGTLTLLLYLGAVILRAIDLGSPSQALGMPEGSIRALIAMSLILIFAIVGFVVLKGSAGQASTSHGLTQAQIDTLRTGGATVVTQDLLPVAAGAPAPSAGLERYDVAVIQPMTADAHNFALQLLTTVSTLLVAVAGFYFGARSVAQAQKTVQDELLIKARELPGPVGGVVGTVPEGPAKADSAAADDEPEETVIDDVGQEDPSDPPGSGPSGTPGSGPSGTPGGGSAGPTMGEDASPGI